MQRIVAPENWTLQEFERQVVPEDVEPKAVQSPVVPANWTLQEIERQDVQEEVELQAVQSPVVPENWTRQEFFSGQQQVLFSIPQ